MPVVGKHCLILNCLDELAQVNAYSPDYEPMELPIVDAAIKYECPYDGLPRYFIIRNALHVKSMDHNLITPFILREKGLTVNNIPKIHIKEPNVDDHSIKFEDGFCVPLQLEGIFSYFPHYAPTARELDETEEIYLLTPEDFNPHDSAYAKNEAAMLDWKGEIVEEKYRPQFLLSEVEEDLTLSSALAISSMEQQAIDQNFDDDDSEDNDTKKVMEIRDPYGIDGVLMTSGVLYSKLKDRSDVAKFQAAIGSTAMHHSSFILEDELSLNGTDDSATDSEDAWPMTDDMDELLELEGAGYIDLDSIFAHVSAMSSSSKSNSTDAHHLSKVWKISYDEAKQTIQATSQRSQRTQNPKLAKNYGTNDRMLRYRRLNTYFFMDTLFATKKARKASRGNTCCQLFVTDKGYVYVVPLKRKADVPLAVKQFAKDVGAPDAIICDAAPEQKQESLKKFLTTIGTTLRVLEEGTPWANRAELYVGLMKRAVLKDMKDSHCPLAFWDYCIERRARINNLTARPLFQLGGTTPHQALTGEEGDISNICRYDWYEWCYFRDQTSSFPFPKEQLGRVLGPARGEGNEMCQWILKSNGEVVPRRTHRPLSVAEQYSEEEKSRRLLFDQLIERRHGTAMSPPKPSKSDDDDIEWDPWDTEEEPALQILDIEDAVDHTGKVINQQPAYDRFINNEVRLPMGDELATGKVIGRNLDDEGRTSGRYDDNPILNSIVYDVEFPDGQVKAYAANTIADSLWRDADIDGYSSAVLDAIIDHKVDWATAVPPAEKYVTTRSGEKRLRQTTRGWKFLLRWSDGKQTWVPLVHVKESHPVHVAKYAQAHGITDHAAFAWWVPYTLKKRDAIISKVKARLRRTNRKYGVEIPTSIEHARRLDDENGNTLWMDALKKEMQNVGIAFEILEAGESAPPGWRKASGHLIWDCKMDFTRKARWVLDGHKQPNPELSTYAGVVSRESVRIAFTYAALNGLNVCAADIQNAYLQSPSSQKDYIICGDEFGLENKGKVALIRRALYGGKSAGRDFRNHLRTCMWHLGFTPCIADPDVWMRPALKSDGSEYYEYILLWTDDSLCISENAEEVLRNQLGKYFKLKESSIGKPTIYLGGKCREVELDNGVKCWAFGSSQCVQNAIKNIEEELGKRRERGDTKYSLPTKVRSPLPVTYAPELDSTPELGPSDASYYLSLIGILRWIVELGRIDIVLEASMMASHSAMPRERHLQAVLRIFGYLKAHHNGEQVYNPSDPAIDESKFERRDWSTSEFGHLEKEDLPENMPQPRGIGFVQRANVDADHASNTVTWKSRTGFIVWLNCAPVYWTSKKQTSVESSSFGSEFIAMKQCCEYIRGLR